MALPPFALWASGIDAHGQLSQLTRIDGSYKGCNHVYDNGRYYNNGDIHRARLLSDDVDILATWSQTIVWVEQRAFILGQKLREFDESAPLDDIRPDVEPDLIPQSILEDMLANGVATFSSHQGLHGMIYRDHLTIVHRGVFAPLQSVPGACWKLTHAAVTASGTTAAAFEYSDSAECEIRVYEFTSVHIFQDWYCEPNDNVGRLLELPCHNEGHRKTLDLLAMANGFALLTSRSTDQDSHVYTWGDGRFGSRVLGRPVTDEFPANQPGTVDALEGLEVRHISCSTVGGLSAAVTAAGEGYVWGKMTQISDSDTVALPGAHFREPAAALAALLNMSEHGIVRIELKPGGGDAHNLCNEDADELSIIDAAVGMRHVVVVDDRGMAWAAGSNDEWQLGGMEDERGGDSLDNLWMRMPIGATPSVAQLRAFADENSEVNNPWVTGQTSEPLWLARRVWCAPEATILLAEIVDAVEVTSDTESRVTPPDWVDVQGPAEEA